MDSRRSSETSNTDKFSKGSISLEFDDYPLDLISPVRRDDSGTLQPPAWKPVPPKDPGQEDDMGKMLSDMDTAMENHEDEEDEEETEVEEEEGEKQKLEDKELRDLCDAIKANGTVLVNRNALPKVNGRAPVKSTLRDNILYDILKDYPIHKHRRTDGRCEPCRTCCISCWRPCLTKYHPMPQNPTFAERLRHSLMCPPHGHVSHVVSLVLLMVLVWGVLWALTGRGALPGGNFFALLMLLVFGYIGGAAVRLIKLPPLLGMLVAGCMMRNIPGINIAKDIDEQWSGALRNTALVVVLLRAGLGLDPRALRRMSLVVLRLAFLPCLVETLTVAVTSHLLMGFPWIWGFLLGFVLSAVTPAVVVPGMLSLAGRGYGTAQGIPTLVIAAAGIDDVIAITGFTIVLGVIFSDSNLVLTIFRGPLEAVGGVLFGIMLGVACWFVPDKHHKHRPLLRFLLLFAGGLFAAFVSRAARCPGSGALSCLVTAFTAALKWRKQDLKEDTPVDQSLAKVWLVLEPLLFGLIGAEVDLHRLKPATIGLMLPWFPGPYNAPGLGLAVVLIGCAVRMVASFLAVLGAGLSLREKFFIPFAWLPKATVQAAIGSVALDTAREKGANEDTVDLALKVVAVAVLMILIKAPVGAAAMELLAPSLLQRHTPDPDPDSDPDAWDKSNELMWDDHLDFDTELTKLKINLNSVICNPHRERIVDRETSI